MVDAAIRIRLEGKVEALENAVRSWGHALAAARRNEFDAAAQMLNDGEVSLRDHGDDDLAGLLSWQLMLRRKLEAVVIKRLDFLGMPSIDPARGARWLSTERVLYEHDRLPVAMLVRLPFIFALMGVVPFVISRSLAGPLFSVLAITFQLGVLQLFGRSHVVLTARRLILEGRVIDLTNATRVLLIRPFSMKWPFHFDVEIYSRSGHITNAKILHAPMELRRHLISLGLDTGNDWGPT